MSFREPGRIETMMTRLATATVASGYYKRLVRDIGLQGNERVMDFGSGSGMASRYIAERLTDGEGHLTCVDVSKVWMGVAKKRTKAFSNVDFKLGEITSLDIENGSYDVIIISFVLHDVDKHERQGMVNEIANKLKSGGRIVIREPTRSDHGMDPTDLRTVMMGAGLTESEGKKVGSRFDAVYRK
jgi:ubiquinone/menaquinone biosynthesis C-methylase UbiE